MCLSWFHWGHAPSPWGGVVGMGGGGLHWHRITGREGEGQRGKEREGERYVCHVELNLLIAGTLYVSSADIPWKLWRVEWGLAWRRDDSAHEGSWRGGIGSHRPWSWVLCEFLFRIVIHWVIMRTCTVCCTCIQHAPHYMYTCINNTASLQTSIPS